MHIEIRNKNRSRNRGNYRNYVIGYKNHPEKGLRGNQACKRNFHVTLHFSSFIRSQSFIILLHVLHKVVVI